MRMPPGFPQRGPPRCGRNRIGCVTRQHIQCGAIVAGCTQRLVADPGLQLRTAPRGVDQTHRHIDALLQLTREVVTRGRKVFHRLRRGALPACSATETALGCRAGLRRHLEHADGGMLGIGNLAARIQRAIHLQFHVRLPRTEPDIADQHIIDLLHHTVGSAGLQAVRAAGGMRGQACLPVALPVCARLHLRSVQLHGDTRAWRRIAPQVNRRITLQHRMVLEHRMQQPCIRSAGKLRQQQRR